MLQVHILDGVLKQIFYCGTFDRQNDNNKEFRHLNVGGKVLK